MSKSKTGLAEATGRLCTDGGPEVRWRAACDLMNDCGAEWITAASAPRACLNLVDLRTGVPAGLMRDYVGAGLPRRDRWLQHCATSTAVDARAPGGGASRGRARWIRPLPTSCATTGRTSSCSSRRGRAAGSKRWWPMRPAPAGLTTSPVRSPVSCRRSPREREALLWLAHGLRTAEIAHCMSIEPVTVSLHHLQVARRKLRARTREQALAVALRGGHIAL